MPLTLIVAEVTTVDESPVACIKPQNAVVVFLLVKVCAPAPMSAPDRPYPVDMAEPPTL